MKAYVLCYLYKSLVIHRSCYYGQTYSVYKCPSSTCMFSKVCSKPLFTLYPPYVMSQSVWNWSPSMEGGLYRVPNTNTLRSRACLKKKSTIGLDTKIRPMFVLISLVTQGAFESTGEREFWGRERVGKGRGCPPHRSDTAFGHWNLRPAVWGVTGHWEVIASGPPCVPTWLHLVPDNDIKYKIIITTKASNVIYKTIFINVKYIRFCVSAKTFQSAETWGQGSLLGDFFLKIWLLALFSFLSHNEEFNGVAVLGAHYSLFLIRGVKYLSNCILLLYLNILYLKSYFTWKCMYACTKKIIIEKRHFI